MPFEHPIAAEGKPDALRNVESFRAPPEHISNSVHSQLSNPQDIASANQFFKPTDAQQFLPPGKIGPSGIEMGAMTPGAKFAAPPMTGLETHGLQAMRLPAGGELSALAGAPGAIPGAEPISPLINMIMKMPGHIGLASSFFEALGAFLAPAQEMLGHLVDGLDMSALFEHAAAAGDAVHGALGAASDHIGVELNLLPPDAPIFNQIGHAAVGHDFASHALKFDGQALTNNAQTLDDSFAQSARLEVGGGPAHPIFEFGPETKNLSFEGGNNNYLALEPNRGFGATVGNLNAANAAPQTLPAPNTLTPAHTAGHVAGASWHKDVLDMIKEKHTAAAHPNSESHAAAHADSTAAHSASPAKDHGASSQAHAPAHNQEQAAAHKYDHLREHPKQHEVTQEKSVEHKGDRISENHKESSGESSYTVHRGDNLWNIAHNRLGDGSRWEEIYDLNKSALGDNPRMIMPGTQLHMPGGDTIAGDVPGGGEYTVRNGDSLWNIAQEHLGGGQNWHELYQHNASVIGADPGSIHAGQHLSLDGSASGHEQTVAANEHAVMHHTTDAHSAHALAHSAQPHSTAPSHGTSQHADAAKTASAHHAQAAKPAGGELQAKAQSLSSIQRYGDAGVQAIDSSSQVPNK